MPFEESLVEPRHDLVQQELDGLDIGRVFEVADEHDATPSRERQRRRLDRFVVGQHEGEVGVTDEASYEGGLVR